MPPVSTNYAEQVLREEAERLAELKENAVSRMALEAKKAEEVKGETCRVKVNLNDEDNFPTLGKVKGKSCHIAVYSVLMQYYFIVSYTTILIHLLIHPFLFNYYSHCASLDQFKCCSCCCS